jgi:hypothetical protein
MSQRKESPGKRRALDIRGRIHTETGMGVHGLTVELLDTRFEYVERLNPTLTAADGSFTFTARQEEFPDLFEACPQVLLRVRDRWGEIIHTSDDSIAWQPGRQTINLTLDSKALQAHLRIPTTWEALTGPLIPPERWAQIDAAITLLAPAGEPEHDSFLRAARCPAPDLMRFETLVEDAFGVLRGNSDARERFTASLGLLEQRQPDTAPRADLDDVAVFERWHASLTEALNEFPGYEMQRVVPEERLVPVMLAAAYAGSLEPRGADRYLSILNDQLCGVSNLDTVWNAALGALGGDEQGLKYFRSVLEQVGTECGPDGGPLPGPRPEPCPIPWPPPRDFDPFKIPLHELKLTLCMLEARIEIGRKTSLGKQSLVLPYNVTAITPQTACVGDAVVITGSGFGSTLQKVSFPAVGGGRAIATPKTWTNNRIEVDVPVGATCGNLQLLIPAGTVKTCEGYLDLIQPGSGATHFDGAAPAIRSFTANGKIGSLRVEPPGKVALAWDICPTSNITANLEIYDRTTGAQIDYVVDLGPTGTFFLDIPNGVARLECKLNASSPCTAGQPPTTATIALTVAKIPKMKIEGMEITQGIQTFWRQGVAPNSLPTIANKDTIVRVYVSADMGGFNNDEVPNVTGTLDVGGLRLHPINAITPTNPSGGNPFITARKAANIERDQTNHTLNFRIPASMAHGTQSLFAYIIAPWVSGTQILSQLTSWTWETKTAVPIRFVRITDLRPPPDGTGTQPTEDQARYTLERAFELLPTPATDIAPAWHATHDFTTTDLSALLRDLWSVHDQPDPATGTPDPAKWIGLTVPWNRGLADGVACVAPIYQQSQGLGYERIRAAHELSHNMGTCHPFMPDCQASGFKDVPLDDVPFDPYWNRAVTGTVFDYMSYTASTLQPWISPTNWNYLRSLIP